MKKRYTVGTCGYFDTDHTIANGQTIKTQIITDMLIKKLGTSSVTKLCYFGWRRNPLKLFFKYIGLIKKCKIVLLFPDANAVKVLIPLGSVQCKLFKTRLYYVVIGGWLPEALKHNKLLRNSLKRIEGVWVETKSLKDSLSNFAIYNVIICPNFKNITILDSSELNFEFVIPLRLCYFSRVTEQKGVGEMVEIIKEINKDTVKFTLDIFGPVSEDYMDTFTKMQSSFPDTIQYVGVVESERVSEALKPYFLHLFPTKYKTEGFPGSVIDSFCVGVPILASRWNSCLDIITDGFDGITFAFEDFDDMKKQLLRIYQNPEIVIDMKKNCLITAEKYTADRIMQIILSELKITK